MRLTFLLGFVALTTMACSVADDATTSQEAEHTAAEPTYANHPWLWANETLDELRAITQEREGATPQFFPHDHPMAERLQFWVDALDAAVRKAHPNALENTPKPKVVIKKDPSINAWVSSIPVAWTIPVRVEGRPDAPGGEADYFFLFPHLEAIIDPSLARRGGASVARTFGKNALAELVTHANGGFASCRLSAGDGGLGASETCARWTNFSSAKRLVFDATGTHVTMTTGYLLEIENAEDAFVATLAHELGHFYRSHITQPVNQTSYFYALEGRDHTHKPPVDPRYQEQTEKVRATLREGLDDFREANALMVSANLGFYTQEQEADELGLELMAKIGVPPSASIDDLFGAEALMERRGSPEHDGVDLAECKKLRERGFKDEAGKWVTVPVGDVRFVHHAFCFRAFNIQREIEAHAYTLGARPKPPGGDFAALVARLRSEVVGAPPPANPPAGDAGKD